MKSITVLKPFIVLVLIFVLFFYKLFIPDNVAFWLVVGLGVAYFIVDLFSTEFIPKQK